MIHYPINAEFSGAVTDDEPRVAYELTNERSGDKHANRLLAKIEQPGWIFDAGE